MLAGIDTLLQDAQKRGYAVGSFNIANMETTMGVLEAAVEKKSPVIIALAETGALTRMTSWEAAVAMIKQLAADLPVPVVIHLDHGRSFEGIVRAIRAGATSVMYDGSMLPFDENVKNTEEFVKIAHAARVPVEAEIGHVDQGAEYANIESDKERFFTKPEEAEEFSRRTGVDALAVAVGTAHGVYVGRNPEIDYERLSTIRDTTDVPLVLHGGSSTGDDKLAKAVACGITKVNIATDMSEAAIGKLKTALAERDGKPMRFTDLLIESKAAYREVAAHYMDVFGSTGKA